MNSSNARGISPRGRPVAVRPLAKPKPCSNPKAKATTQGCRIVRLVSPRHERTISGPRNRMLSAMAALSGSTGMYASLCRQTSADRLVDAISALTEFDQHAALRQIVFLYRGTLTRSDGIVARTR